MGLVLRCAAAGLQGRRLATAVLEAAERPTALLQEVEARLPEQPKSLEELEDEARAAGPLGHLAGPRGAWSAPQGEVMQGLMEQGMMVQGAMLQGVSPELVASLMQLGQQRSGVAAAAAPGQHQWEGAEEEEDGDSAAAAAARAGEGDVDYDMMARWARPEGDEEQHEGIVYVAKVREGGKEGGRAEGGGKAKALG